MQRPIEALARELAKIPSCSDTTIGELAKKHGESVERMLDASCVLKLLEATGALDGPPITYISIGEAHV